MKAVIFDRDGVILDSEAVNLHSALIAFKKLGIEVKEKEKKEIIGMHPLDYKTFFQERYSFSFDKFYEIQGELYYDQLKKATLFTEIIDLIKELHKKRIPIALTTSSNKKSTNIVLNYAKLENIFDTIITAESCEESKPNPKPYLLTAEKLNIDPKECIVIEDSNHGVIAAKKARMMCIAIPNETTKYQDFSNADLIITSRKDINIELLKNVKNTNSK